MSGLASLGGGVKTEGGDSAMASPYYLSPSDNPGTSISTVTLNGENYAEWAQDFWNALRAKRKICFIDETLKCPCEKEKPNDAELWKTVNSMIVGWIRASISDSLRSTIAFTPDAYKLWCDIKRRFEIGNAVREYQLKSELASCKQNGSSVMEYFGRLSLMWDELINYKPILECTCGASEKFVKQAEEERVHQFLMGLDEARFGNGCANIIGLDPLPDINTVYQKVVREERRIGASRSEPKQDVVGFTVKTEPTGIESSTGSALAAVARSRSIITCTHCGKTGHDRKDCWQIIGYPEWYNEKTNDSRGRGQGRGRGCGRASQVRMNKVQAHTTTVPNLSAEQWVSITALIESQKPHPIPEKLHGKVQTVEVILDTGASHHMTGDVLILTDMKTIMPCPVSFADGSQVMATKSGCLKLSQKLVLQNVLFVENLNCTLLSVAKLLKQTGGFAVFTDTLCMLQDHFTRTMIGIGEERDGVYFFQDVTMARGNRVAAGEDEALWHCRLGHPSYGVLSFLPFISGASHKPDKFGGCEICFRSKQTREMFSESSNKASSPFVLIHCDLWGPYRVPSSCGAVYFLTIVDDFSRAVWIHLLLEKKRGQNRIA